MRGVKLAEQQLKPPQTAPEDRTGGDDASLEAQLDALLSQIEQDEQIPAAEAGKVSDQSTEAAAEAVAGAAGSGVGEVDSPTATPADEIAAADPAETDEPTLVEGTFEAPEPEQEVGEAEAAPQAAVEAEPAAESNPEDDLARQIQALLDQASDEEERGAASAAEPAAAGAETGPSEQPASASQGAAEPISLDELDTAIADEADDTVAGEFETVDQALNEDRAAAPADQASGETAHAADENEQALQGAFESPENLLSGQEAGQPAVEHAGFTAKAADVAAELDDQPENKVSAQAQAPREESAADQGEVLTHGPALRHWLDTADTTARQVCRVVNGPMARFSPEVRRTVGYVGLLTLANGMVMLLFGLL